MRKNLISLTVAAIAATAAFAPAGASADWRCVHVGKDGAPLESAACVNVQTQEGSTTVSVACEIAHWAMCAIDPVTVPVGVGPITTQD
jgi:hypothetical protein